RRNTRCYPDWSSDVCSSDLDLVDRAKLYLIKLDPQSLSRIAPRVSAEGHVSAPRADVRMLRVRIFKEGLTRPKVTVNLPMTLARSEERRVGKEATREWWVSE